MKYLKFIVILMGLLIFFGTSAILYIVFDKLFSKEKLKEIQGLTKAFSSLDIDKTGII